MIEGSEDWSSWIVALTLAVTALLATFGVKEYRALKDPTKGDTLSEWTRRGFKKVPGPVRKPFAVITLLVLPVGFLTWFFVHIVYQGGGI